MTVAASQVSAQAAIPSIDRLLNDGALAPLVAVHGRTAVRDVLRRRLADWRAAMARGGDDIDLQPVAIARAIAAELERADDCSLRRVANLTGTVLHTNLGRALLPEEAIDAMARAAAAPCNVEFDLEAGERGERDAHVEALLTELTGAKAALVVNNNAAAVLLLLNTLALRKEVIVSRGELVEIGGQFRIPDIMSRAGARLREVGTTNRTHAADYVNAIGARTALLMKVHTSNYDIRGFTAAVDEAALARIGAEHGVDLVTDLGSGTLVDLERWGLPREPTAAQMIAAGAAAVCFSGDKLLGGPQCGLIVGRADVIGRLRRNPLKRALRVDKLTLAALEQVLRLYRDPDRLQQRLPTLRLLTRTREEIRPVAQRLAAAFERVLAATVEVTVVDCMSQIGSGALPVATLASAGVRMEPRVARSARNRAVMRLARALRQLPVPILGRLEDGALLLDCRCLDDEAGAHGRSSRDPCSRHLRASRHDSTVSLRKRDIPGGVPGLQIRRGVPQGVPGEFDSHLFRQNACPGPGRMRASPAEVSNASKPLVRR